MREYAQRLKNGGALFLLPEPTYPTLRIPDLSAPDSSQEYDIGTAYMFNGKAYYYAYTSAAANSRQGACTAYKQEVSQQLLGADAAIYAESITLTVAATDGIAANGAIAKDYLKGGSVVVFPSGSGGSSYDFTRGIVSNAAVATSGGTMVVELDGGIPYALTAATSVAEAGASPWRAILNSTAAWMPKVGVPTCYAAAGKYVWVQTWGLCWVAPQTGIGTAGYHHAIFKHDGSVEKITTVDLNHSDQYAGWSSSWGAAGAQAAPFIFLMIACP